MSSSYGCDQMDELNEKIFRQMNSEMPYNRDNSLNDKGFYVIKRREKGENNAQILSYRHRK